MMRGRRDPGKKVRRWTARSSAPRVHARGEARLDAMLALAEEASRDAPLAEVLTSLCTRIAAMLSVDVCSIYLREAPQHEAHHDVERREAGDLVLRATHGYPGAAVGAVRMRVGEGLTGFAVECLRPVSVARAPFDARNKAFPGLDEERFPSLCALPLVDGGRAVGALVIQRRQPRAFGQREIVLAASVAAPVLFALERARTRERDRIEPQQPVRGRRPHEVLLRGIGVAPGAALGTVCVRRHAPARPVADRAGAGDPADERARLGKALAEAAEEVANLESWAAAHAPLAERSEPLPRGCAEGNARVVDRGTMMALLSPARFVLDDARLRGRMLKHVSAGASAEEAVERVMREYTRVLSSAPLDDGVLAERALEVESLCQRVMQRLGAPRAPLDPGTVLCASRLTVCDAIELAAAHGTAVALAGDASGSSGIAVAVALGLPVVCGVKELFRWVADGDRLLVSGRDGTVTVNPSRVDVAAHRRR